MVDRQAAALFLIAPMIAVSIAPPAPPAIACEMMPPTLRLPDCAAAMIAGSNNVTIWPSTPPPTKPEIMLPIIPRSKVGDDLPANATKRPCNEVDQNLFHVDLPAFQLASSLSRNDLGVEFSWYCTYLISARPVLGHKQAGRLPPDTLRESRHPGWAAQCQPRL